MRYDLPEGLISIMRPLVDSGTTEMGVRRAAAAALAGLCLASSSSSCRIRRSDCDRDAPLRPADADDRPDVND